MKVSINWLKELVDLKEPIEKLVEILNLKTIGTKEVTDKFIELDMKGYNRADLLSLRGVAYETAAITDSQIKFEEPNGTYFWTDKSLPELEVNVEDEKLTPIYCLAKIEGLKVEKSPEDWVKKLEDSGYRSINNVADLTNLLMLEYGQPMHAFDAGKVSGNVGVRLAKHNETIQTLDEKDRQLTTEDLLIVDDKGPIGLAGVMGGKDSEISDATTSVLLEAAIFDPGTLRKTATRLGLTSEASKRFYHGLAKIRLLQALSQALMTLEEMGGKVTSLTLKGDFEDKRPNIPLTLERTNSLVGVEFKSSEIVEYLKKLNFEIKTAGSGWMVTPPYYRLDVNIEEDVIEEVARMYGYEKIQPETLPGNPPTPSDQSLFQLIDKTRQSLVNLGLTEIQTYSFYSTSVLEALGFDEENNRFLIKVANPISSETEYMRMNLWPNLVEALGKNQKLGLKDIAIFEVGKVYIKGSDEDHTETLSLGIALTNESDNPLSELNSIFSKLGWEAEVEQVTPEGPAKVLFHPTRFLSAKSKDEFIGGLSEVHLRVLDKLGIRGRVAILEVVLEKL